MKKILVVFFGIWLLVAGEVGAHANGASFERNISGYVIDVGYDPATFIADEQVAFDFNILQGENEVEYDQVWVKIFRDQKTYLATGIKKSEFAKTTLVYVFPEAGDYQLSVSFRKTDAVVAEDNIVIKVDPATPADSPINTGMFVWPAAAGVVGVVVGGLGVAIINKKKWKNFAATKQ